MLKSIAIFVGIMAVLGFLAYMLGTFLDQFVNLFAL